eukprot:Nk52_evm17s238 gene=Nk52_evmTU17s238
MYGNEINLGSSAEDKSNANTKSLYNSNPKKLIFSESAHQHKLASHPPPNVHPPSCKKQQLHFVTQNHSDGYFQKPRSRSNSEASRTAAAAALAAEGGGVKSGRNSREKAQVVPENPEEQENTRGGQKLRRTKSGQGQNSRAPYNKGMSKLKRSLSVPTQSAENDLDELFEKHLGTIMGSTQPLQELSASFLPELFTFDQASPSSNTSQSIEDDLLTPALLDSTMDCISEGLMDMLKDSPENCLFSSDASSDDTPLGQSPYPIVDPLVVHPRAVMVSDSVIYAANEKIRVLSKHNSKGEFLNSTPSSELVLGYTPVELEAKSIYDFILPDDVPKLRGFIQKLLSTKQGPGASDSATNGTGLDLVCRMVRKNKEVVLVHMKIVLLYGTEGEFKGMDINSVICGVDSDSSSFDISHSDRDIATASSSQIWTINPNLYETKKSENSKPSKSEKAPKDPLAPTKKKSFKPLPQSEGCTECRTKLSPEWRKGPMGPKTLCNACGLRYSKKIKQAEQKAKLLAASQGLPIPETIKDEKAASKQDKANKKKAQKAQLQRNSSGTSSMDWESTSDKTDMSSDQ